MRPRAIGGITLTLLLATSSVAAQKIAPVDQEGEYAACMDLTRTKPADALERARAWVAQSGEDAARHCAAVAMIGLGRYDEAAVRLDALAADLDPAEVDLRVGVLAQSGQAWLLAADAAHALVAQTAALKLAPDTIEVLIDRSISLVTLTRYWDALDDLNHALDLAPGRAEILVFRASAYRYLETLDLARDDIDRALMLEPNNPDGLLERGILKRLAGEPEAARADWQRVLTVADDSPAADVARSNLTRLDDTSQ
ncbi:MAG: tetratricopeptide repeat protein [Alphaproteobacteria bacterium]